VHHPPNQPATPPGPSAAAIWPPLRRFIAEEYRLGRLMARGRWTSTLYEFFRFGLKQAWACLFGGIAVFLMLAVVLSGERVASALRLSVSLHDHGSARTARNETGDVGRGQGDPDLSLRRNGGCRLKHRFQARKRPSPAAGCEISGIGGS